MRNFLHLSVSGCLICCGCLAALPAVAENVAMLEEAQGEITVKYSQARDFIAAAVGTKFSADDTLHVGAHSRAAVSFVDGGFLRLGENTLLRFEPKENTSRPRIKMDEGRAYYFGREPRQAPLVDTPSVTTAIRGTEFALEVSKTRTVVSVLDGSVSCANARGEVTLTSGEQAVTAKDALPQKTILVRPLDAVQWALYYPAVVTEAGFTPRAGGPSKEEQALLGAARLLSMGHVEAARAQLALALGAQAGAEVKAAALAQQAVIALVQNDRSQAQAIINQAQQASPSSAAVLLARSYVAQSAFDLEQARDAARQLVKTAPGLAAGHARLAELELGFGEYRAAKSAAEKALGLDAGNAYVRAVYGFTQLFAADPAGAQQSFELAQRADGALALARLGVGLSRIQQGDLAGGRRELEAAAFLAPEIAVYRSYLGKAFYEERREGLAEHEYMRAMKLDARDPTPYIYRAYSRVAANDPVQALQDVERSIELNDNRAVYRSSLLLDQDLGARSAALSETYSALGFARAAQVEAVKSLGRSYANYSAHLLLSDSYASIMDNDAARAERRIANLLAPVSFNMFSHQSGSGSLNEYDNLFDRPDGRTELGGEWSSYDDLLDGGAAYTGKTGKFGYRASVEALMTGGSKHNDYSRLEKADLSAAYQMQPETKLSLSGSTSYNRINEQYQIPDESSVEHWNAEAGFSHQFSAASRFIAAGGYESNRNRYLAHTLDRPSLLREVWGDEEYISENPLIVDEFSRDGLKQSFASAQFLAEFSRGSAVWGAELHHSGVKRREESPLLADELGLFEGIEYSIRTRGEYDLDSYDFYSYHTLRPASWLDLNLSGSYSTVEGDRRDIPPYVDGTFNKSRFNPKVGVAIYPNSSLTLRGAYFETLRKSALEDSASIEPTLVAGINQLYNDLPGARSRTIAAAVDYKLSGSTYTGLQAVRRHVVEFDQAAVSEFTLDYDKMELSPGVLLADSSGLHGDQNFMSAYLSQILSPTLSANLEYDVARLQRTDPELDQDMKLQRAAAAVRYFHSSGLFPYVRATWRRPEQSAAYLPEELSDDFTLVDAGVGYRMPQRHGVVLLQVSNIFDRDFTYDQSFGIEPFVSPGVGVSLRAAVNF